MTFTQMTQDELREYFGVGEIHPADLRETMRTKLAMLPTAARTVYCRDNIADPKTPLLTIVETVLYHFDLSNRRKVAKALDLEYDDMILMLIGYILGNQHLKSSVNALANKLLSMDSLTRKVQAMRDAQKDYFQHRTRSDLERAKALERSVDAQILNIINGGT